MEKRCIYCGKILSLGRADRKFCDALCKARFHNARNYYANSPKTTVIKSLETNYHILCDVISSGEGSAMLVDLVDEGFRPEYVTSYLKARGGDELRCFDIKYRQSGLRIFNVRKKV